MLARISSTLILGTLLLSQVILPYAVLGQDNGVNFTPEEQAYIERKEYFKLAVDPDWMPFESIDRNGDYIGISADLIDLIKEKSNLDIRLVPTSSWSETLELARNREIDIVSLANRTSDRETYLNFTEPVIEVQSVVATLNSRPYIQDIGDIRYQPIGVIRDYSHGELLRENYPGINLVVIENYEEGLDKVQSGQLYGIVGNIGTISYVIQRAKISNMKIAGRVTEEVHLRIASRNDEPILNDILNKVLGTISEQERDQIVNKWFSVKYETPPDYKITIWVSLGFILIMIFVGIWSKKLRDINRKLESLNKQKDYFFSIIGHDLRNPLTAISGYSSIILEEADTLDKVSLKKFASTINTNSAQIVQTLNQLLEWSRIELNQDISISKEFNLEKLVNVTFNLYEINAGTKGVTLKNEVPADIHLDADEHMVSTILRNLIFNAIKYSTEGDSVSVLYKKQGQTQQIIVRDTGVGISDQRIAEILSEKVVSSTQGTNYESGSGLGLYICKKYAEKLGGKLKISSQQGSGSDFILELYTR